MRSILIVMALMLCFTLAAQIPEAPTQGTGSPSDPFHIANFGNLFWMAQTPGVWNQHFVQTADIDASDSALISSPEPNTAGWIPIGNGSTTFSGSYDGQGYGIYNLFLHRPTMSYTGLFGYMNGAKLNRINLRTVYILGQTYTGGLRRNDEKLRPGVMTRNDGYLPPIVCPEPPRKPDYEPGPRPVSAAAAPRTQYAAAPPPRSSMDTAQGKFGLCEHKIFGQGKIIAEIPPDKYRVNFPGFGLKVIVKAYVKLL